MSNTIFNIPEIWQRAMRHETVVFSKPLKTADDLVVHMLSQPYVKPENALQLLKWLDDLITQNGDLAESIIVRDKDEFIAEHNRDLTVADWLYVLISDEPRKDLIPDEYKCFIRAVTNTVNDHQYVDDLRHIGRLNESRLAIPLIDLIAEDSRLQGYLLTEPYSNSDECGIDALIQTEKGWIPFQLKTKTKLAISRNDPPPPPKQRTASRFKIELKNSECEDLKAQDRQLAQKIKAQKIPRKKGGNFLELYTRVHKFNVNLFPCDYIKKQIQKWVINESYAEGHEKFIDVADFERLSLVEKLVALRKAKFFVFGGGSSR